MIFITPEILLSGAFGPINVVALRPAAIEIAKLSDAKYGNCQTERSTIAKLAVQQFRKPFFCLGTVSQYSDDTRCIFSRVEAFKKVLLVYHYKSY